MKRLKPLRSYIRRRTPLPDPTPEEQDRIVKAAGRFRELLANRKAVMRGAKKR